MGIITTFYGNLTTSRPLTIEELNEYNDVSSKSENMYLIFVDGSTTELEGPYDCKIVGYIDVEKGFLDTLHWLKSKGITLSGRINYCSEDVFSDYIGGWFGAFVATSENVTCYELDFNGLQIVSNVIYDSTSY
jgi:hypothetical protein